MFYMAGSLHVAKEMEEMHENNHPMIPLPISETTFIVQRQNLRAITNAENKSRIAQSRPVAIVISDDCWAGGQSPWEK